MNREQRNGNTVRIWEQALALYHPNTKGTGCALQLEPRINRRPSDRANCFFLDLAPQKTTAGRTERGRTPATFDWERKVTVKLGFNDICEILAVLEARTDHAGGSRKGLYHDTGSVNTLISFQKDSQNRGFYLGVSRKGKGDAQGVRLGFVLSEAEAIGLRNILQTGLFFVLFHTHLFTPLTKERG